MMNDINFDNVKDLFNTKEDLENFLELMDRQMNKEFDKCLKLLEEDLEKKMLHILLNIYIKNLNIN